MIVSASLGVYLRPIAERLRFDAVLCTELEVGPDGTLTGEMPGRTCAGSRRRGASTSGSVASPTYVWAYGDSSGDRVRCWAQCATTPARDGSGSTHRDAALAPNRARAANALR